MPIVNSEKRALRPGSWVLALRPSHIKNDRHSILIVVPLDSLVSISGVARNQPVRLRSEFGIFEIFERVEIGGMLADRIQVV